MRGLFVVVVLIATLVSQGTAQLPFGPQFHLSQYQATERETEVVRLSAPILTRPQIPAFTGRIEVDITAEDLPSGDPRQNALFGTDYLVNSQNPSSRAFTVVFQSKQANSTEHVIVVANDSIVEGTETFRLRIVAARFIGQAATIFRAQDGLNNTVADVTIEDDDFVEVSWIISEPIQVREGEGVRLELFAQAFGLYATPIEIGVICAGVSATGVPSAYPGRDFVVLSGSTLEFTDVETLRSNSSNNVTLLIIDDEITEPCESFLCTLQGGAVDQVRGVEPNRATVRICDDDVAGVYFDPDVYMVNEDSSVTLILKINVTVNYRFSVLVNTHDDSANSPTDYLGGERRAIFEIGSSMATVEYSTVNDSTREGNERFTAELTVPLEVQAVGIVSGIPDRVTVNIIDDEELVCMFVRTMHEVREDMGPLVTVVMCSVPSDEPFTLIVQTSDGTTLDGQDYTRGDYSVIFPAGSTKESVSIPITDDDIFESDETFFLTLVIPQPAQDIGVMRGDPFMATVTIIDDDASVTIYIENRVIDVIEDQTYVEVCLVKSGPSSRPVMALVNPEELTSNVASPVSIDATSQVDFELVVTMITLAPSETRKCVNVTIIDDEIVERTETFEVIITFPPGQPALQIGEIVPPAMQITITINIIDDDAITVQFKQDMYMVDESDGVIDVTVIASGRTSFTYMFTVTPMNLTATNNFDYTYPTVTYSFGPTDENEPIPSLVISIPIINDGDNEFDEDFKLTLEVSADGEAANVTEGPISMTVVLVKDDDAMIPVRFNPANYSVKEGVDGNAVIFLEALINHNFDFTVIVNSQDGTAVDGSDYTGGPFEVTFPAGVNVVSFNVSILDDAIAECAKLFNLDLDIPDAAAGMGVLRGSPDTATVHIMDDDVEDLFLSIENADYMVKENVGSFVAAVVSSRAADFEYTVTVETSDGTAVGGDDFVSQQYMLTFPAGQTRAEFTVVITDDNLIESMESFQLLLSIPEDFISKGVQVGPNSAATVTIMDNDGGTVSFSPQNYSIPEGTDAELNIVLDKAFSTDLTFDVTTMDGTATSPSDYTGGRYHVTIPALKKEGKVLVFTSKSGELEPEEHFKATLHAPEHPSLSTGVTTAVITIHDRTIPVVFKQATYHVTEGPGAKATITVKTVVQRDYPFDVVVSTRSGRAGGADFQDENYMVHFEEQAEEADFTVTIFDDDIAECPEEFFLELMIPPNADRMGVIKGDLSNAKVVINDTDCAEMNFKVQTYTVNEGETVNLKIELDKDFSCDQREVFCIQTIDDTATAHDDYKSVDKCFPFEPNMTYSVETIDDATPEKNECFNVMIGPFPGASNVKIGKNNTATVCLCDSSRVTIGFKEASYTVSEGMQVRLVVALDERAERDIEFTVTTRDGTADSHSEIDYFRVNTTSTIWAGTLEMSVMVITQKTIYVEDLEHFYADLSASGECDRDNVDFGIKTAKITIVDLTVFVSLRNDNNEEVSYSAKEGVNHTCVTLKAVGANIQTAFDVIVVAKNGSATYPSDYAAREVTATFLPGETTANACIPIVDDDVHECLEWFTLELSLTQAAVDLCAVLSLPFTARVHIEDNDVVSIAFDPLTYDITEGDLGELNFFLNRRSQTNISFIAMTMDGTADGSDYVGGNFPATIHAGMKNVTLPQLAKADVLLESTEFYEVVIKPNATSPNCSEVLAGPPANVSIIDGTVLVKFSASVYHVCTVQGRPSSVAITMEAMKDHKFDFTVKVHIRDGTAKRNSDYDDGPVITKRFRIHDRNVTIPISIIAGGDMVEPPENFTVELEIPKETKRKGVVAVEPSTAEVVISDVPIGTVSPQNYTVREGEVAHLTIVLDRPSMQDMIFNVATMSLTATTFDDYFRHNYNVTVPAGAMEATTTVVTTRNAKIEAEEQFKAIVHPLVKCDLEDGENTAYITITDCTVQVMFSIASTVYTATEGMDPKVTITVLANGAVDESDFSIRVIAKDGTATSGDDYVIKDTLLLFKRGDTEHSFSISITDDVLAEPHEVFTLELERPQPTSTACIARGTPDITLVRLADDDVVTISFSPLNYTVSEGSIGWLGMVLDKEASESITVFVTTTDITAGYADYVQENSTPVKFAPGAMVAVLPLLTLRDTVVNEPNEDLKVTLDFEPTTVRVEIGPDPCFVTITDATVGVKFRSAMYMVGEGDGSVTVTVEASKEHADFDFVIKMVAQDGTAETASDLHEQEVNVTFPAGKTTVEASIGINDDLIAESIEIFHLVLEIPEKTTGNGVVAIAPNTTDIKIIDNDEVNITFKAPAYYIVLEGNTTELVLEVQGESAEDIMVNVMFTTITAENDDYNVSSKNVTIPAYAREIKIPVEALRDTDYNGTEFIKASLILIQQPPVKVNILSATAYIAIADATECQVQGEEYFDGVDSCVPCTGTCEEPTKVCTLECRRGCGCPVGTVLDEEANTCVNVTDCPKDPSCPQECSRGFCRRKGPNAECSVPGSTGPACTGTCHVTKCRACYYSEEVHNCPVGCRYACGEDPNGKCFKKWSKCVKDGFGNMAGRKRANRFKCVDPCTC